MLVFFPGTFIRIFLRISEVKYVHWAISENFWDCCACLLLACCHLLGVNIESDTSQKVISATSGLHSGSGLQVPVGSPIHCWGDRGEVTTSLLAESLTPCFQCRSFLSITPAQGTPEPSILQTFSFMYNILPKLFCSAWVKKAYVICDSLCSEPSSLFDGPTPGNRLQFRLFPSFWWVFSLKIPYYLM